MFIATFVCIMAIQPLFAQKAPTRVLGSVIDAFTCRRIQKEVEVSLLDKDSTILQTVRFGGEDENGNVSNQFSMCVPEREEAAAILKFVCKGYKTTYKPIKMVWRKREALMTFYRTPMRKLSAMEERMLDEFTVTATKIKFYTKNDTLVYNADAFNLADGSMLDELVAQMPGAELKPDGRILVNGRQVESLLLNGRDFFKGNNTVLLDNLPAYMVQQVQVYEKESDMSKAVGQKMDNGRFVMDVKLKKQYSVGWMANLEGGYGTADRYLGRLFAMRYTSQSRVSLFGNINNVNARRKPDGNADWGDFDVSGGQTYTKHGGVDYSVYDKRQRYEVSGSADVSYSDNENIWGGNATNFILDGNTYESRRSIANSSNLSLSTGHYFKYKKNSGVGHCNFTIEPRFNYYKNDNNRTYLNGTFSEQPLEDYTAVLDGLFSPEWATTVRNLIKRNGEWAKGNGHGSSGGVEFWTYMNTPYTDNGLTMEASVDYSSSRNKNYNHFTYNWFDNNVLQHDYRNRYNTTPADNFGYRIMAKYIWWVGKGIMLNPSYELKYTHSYGETMRYSLTTDDDSHDLNWLPSQMEQIMNSLDADNCYKDRFNRYYHTVALDWQWNNKKKDESGNAFSSWYLKIRPFVEVQQSNYLFTDQKQQKINKTYVLPNLDVALTHDTPGYRHKINAGLHVKTSTPNVFNLVDRTFTNDPLNVSKGNPDLEQVTEFSTDINYRSNKWLQDNGRFLYGDAGLWILHNGVSTSFSYDSSTGVRTTRPINVDGNWRTWASLGFSTPIDRARKLTFTTESGVSYQHTVDYAGSNGVESAVRVLTKGAYVTENLKLDYRYKKVNVGLKGNVAYNASRTNRNDFHDQDIWNIRYGGHAIVDLPWDMQLSTDMTMFSRHGYESREMNSNDFVWNARLSKKMYKKRLTLMVDAWDILGNLSNINAGMDGQERWEYYNNVIPRYALFRLLYRFEHQPKKKR